MPKNFTRRVASRGCAIVTCVSTKLCFWGDLSAATHRRGHVGLAQQHKVFAQLADHWQPKQPGLIPDIDRPSYFAA
jgi:hypothetical protein